MQNNGLPVDRSRSLLHRANQAFFFVGGFGVASWAPLVPLLKARLGVAEDVLGLLLLCIGVGSLVTMPFAGVLAGHFGCRRVIAVDSLVFAALLVALARVDNIVLAVPTLLLFGSSMGIIDVTINIHAVRVEQLLKRRVMSGMHALWSVGGFMGAGLFGVWLALGARLRAIFARGQECARGQGARRAARHRRLCRGGRGYILPRRGRCHGLVGRVSHRGARDGHVSCGHGLRCLFCGDASHAALG